MEIMLLLFYILMHGIPIRKLLLNQSGNIREVLWAEPILIEYDTQLKTYWKMCASSHLLLLRWRSIDILSLVAAKYFYMTN